MPNYHGFDKVATIPNKRTKLDSLSYEKKMTINQGDLRPVYFQEVLPGMMIHLRDAFSIKNIPSPLKSVIDDAYLDINYFFVPRRLLWKDWESFIGADATPDAYTDPQSYAEPTCYINLSDIGGPDLGSVINDFGIPSDIPNNLKISPFPLACFGLCWNEFYRDENLQDENPFPATVYALSSGANLALNSSNAAWLYKKNQVAFNSVNKYHDLFTSLLPSPQKGDPVSLPLGSIAPVKSQLSNGTFGSYVYGGFYLSNGTTASGADAVKLMTADNLDLANGQTSSSWHTDEGVGGTLRTYTDGSLGGGKLVADLSTATASTINDLRLAFAAQAYLEALARGGSRYTELLHQMFGISPSDARLQRPEFLGTLHKRLSFTSVASTNGVPDTLTASQTVRPTGSLGGYSVTGGDQDVFFKQFEEHGYVIGLGSIRVRHTYGQGIPKIFLKKDRFDYWSKYFDRIGEVPVSKEEIFSAGTGTLGFQEAWYEYKFHANEISGAIAPQGTDDMVAFTYADDYGSTAPTLSSDFIRETRSNIDQTLIGASGVPQYVIDLYHQVTAVVPLSVTSVPAGIGF